jgi:hypothetical protein
MKQLKTKIKSELFDLLFLKDYCKADIATLQY